MFLATDRVPLFDYLRIPYRVVGSAALSPSSVPDDYVRIACESKADAVALAWPSRHAFPDARAEMAAHRLGEVPLFARVTDPDAVARGVAAPASRIMAVSDASGQEVSWIQRTPDGTVVLPFDPAEAMEACWTEGYLAATHGSRPLTALARRAYYRLRPVMPRSLQIAMRRRYSRIQGRTAFPQWPAEPALHDLIGLLYRLLSDVAGEPVPWIAPWPRPHDWALVLTHDVETADGYRAVGSLRAAEEAVGYRSSWNFVPRRYAVEPAMLRELRDNGFEVGLHGLYHDGRDLESATLLAARLPEMLATAEQWGAVGFRAPATQRAAELIGMLPFEYDSSYPDTDPYEPQPGGCCSWLPFLIREVVELPITLPQDHTLFVILQQVDERTWVDKTRLLRARGGMALLLTHPDYMDRPERLAAYRRYLAAFSDDPSAWRALPREVATWWRRRSASTLERAGSGWRIAGPAADAGAVLTTAPR